MLHSTWPILPRAASLQPAQPRLSAVAPAPGLAGDAVVQPRPPWRPLAAWVHTQGPPPPRPSQVHCRRLRTGLAQSLQTAGAGGRWWGPAFQAACTAVASSWVAIMGSWVLIWQALHLESNDCSVACPSETSQNVRDAKVAMTDPIAASFIYIRDASVQAITVQSPSY